MEQDPPAPKRDRRDVDYVLAALKGVVECENPHAYLGKVETPNVYVQIIRERGMVVYGTRVSHVPTDKGREIYGRYNLRDLEPVDSADPRDWDWSVVPPKDQHAY